MILEKNNLTVQERNKFYIELLNSLICTPKNSNHQSCSITVDIAIRPGKQIDLFVYCICISCCIHQSLLHCFVRETMDNWTSSTSLVY